MAAVRRRTVDAGRAETASRIDGPQQLGARETAIGNANGIAEGGDGYGDAAVVGGRRVWPRPDGRPGHAAVGRVVAGVRPAVGRSGRQPPLRQVRANTIYWLTEDSAIGRRRLVASTDKRYYRPGETVSLLAQTYDESANRTSRYRVVALLEPSSSMAPTCRRRR